MEIPQEGYYVVHLKSNTDFTNEDQKEPRCLAAWVFQSWCDATEDCTNCKDGEGIFADCRAFKGAVRWGSVWSLQYFQESSGRTTEGAQKDRP